MKKLLLMCAALLALVACKNENGGIAQKDIVGKWNVTEQWDAAQNKWVNVSELGLYAQFNADNTYKASDGTGTYKIEGNTIVCAVGSTTVKYEFALNGNNAEATVTVGSNKPYKVKATRV